MEAVQHETDDLLRLSLPFGELRVWSKSVEDARALLRRTLSTRRAQSGTLYQRFWLTQPDGHTDVQFVSCEPVFFENREYELRFVVDSDDIDLTVSHLRDDIRSSFRRARGEVRGWVAFGNDVGRFVLDLVVRRHERAPTTYRLALEVLPTKLDMEGDLAAIHRELDQQFPLWRFAFGRKTELGQRRTRASGARILLLWMAQFRSLLSELERSIQIISRAPHRRLRVHVREARAEELRGRLRPRLEERIDARTKDA